MTATIRFLKPVAPPSAPPRGSMPREPDHDLPLLAAEKAGAPRPQWDRLLAAGIQPALVLGAERRLQGKR